eukprot:1533954-Pleurochrysis_carterae.AAC.1
MSSQLPGFTPLSKSQSQVWPMTPSVDLNEACQYLVALPTLARLLVYYRTHQNRGARGNQLAGDHVAI